MGTKTVTVKVVGDASSARKELGSVAAETDKLGARAGTAFGALANIAGQSGVFGPLADVMAKVGEGMDFVAENGRRAGTVMIGVGGAAAAAGLMMTKAAEKDVLSQKQLQVAVQNSGHSYEEYRKRIEQAVRTQEKFGHTADQTQEALRKLTDSTDDPTKALGLMGLVADIAASRHIELADAAALVAKILNGTGGKALASYGIHIDKSKDKTQELERALDELASKTSGQAAAGAETFGGQMDAMGARIKDVANDIGAKLGPALTFAGAALTGLGTAMEAGTAVKGAYAAMTARVAASQAAQAAAAQAATVAAAEAAAAMAAATAGTGSYAAAANAAAVAQARLAAANARASSSMMATAGKAGMAGLAVAGLTWGSKALVDVLVDKASPSVTKLAADLQELGETGRRGGEFDKFFGGGKFESDFKLATDDSLWGKAKRGMGDYTGALGPASSAMQLFGTSAADAKERNTELAAALAQLTPQAAGDAFRKLTEDMNPAAAERFKATLIELNPALDAVLNSSTVASGGLGKISTAAHDAMVSLQRVGKQFSILSGHLNIDSAALASAAAIREMSAALKANGANLGMNTVKGAANRAQVIQASQAFLTERDTMLKNNVALSTVNRTYSGHVAALRASMIAGGANRAVVDALINRYLHVPRAVSTKVSAPGLHENMSKADSYRSALRSIPSRVVTDIISRHHDSYDSTGRGGALGGPVVGGIPGKDSVPRLLMPREFIVRADGSNLDAAAAYYGRKVGGTSARASTMTAAAGGGIHIGTINLPGVGNAREFVRALNKLADENGGNIGLNGKVSV